MTKNQSKLLAFIREYIEHNNIAPSYDDMRTALGLKSKSGIHTLLTGLEERGYIRRLKAKTRAIEVIKFTAKRKDMNLIKFVSAATLQEELDILKYSLRSILSAKSIEPQIRIEKALAKLEEIHNEKELIKLQVKMQEKTNV